MPDPIVATVVEPKRKPRPTRWHAFGRSGEVRSIDGRATLEEAETIYANMLAEHGSCIAKIHGELEAARAARIEKLRKEVIGAARFVAAVDRPSTELAAALSDLRDSLTLLTAAESEGAANV